MPRKRRPTITADLGEELKLLDSLIADEQRSQIERITRTEMLRRLVRREYHRRLNDLIKEQAEDE